MAVSTMTPYELNIYAEGQYHKMLTSAWHTAALSRISKFPPLKKLIDGNKPPTEQEIKETRQWFEKASVNAEAACRRT
jgi:hypothetical protein